jgi:hypothetical protein
LARAQKDRGGSVLLKVRLETNPAQASGTNESIRIVELGRFSRSGLYRFHEGPAGDMDLRDAVQRIALEWPRR